VHPPEVERARELRNNMTKVECFVWSRLRNRQLAGYKFRRQVPIGPYFADFACLTARLVVKVDGDTHTEEADAMKTAFLEGRGFRVVRISVGEVDDSIDDVMDAILLGLGHDI
jgi:very-short-patch-repair endonuclease